MVVSWLLSSIVTGFFIFANLKVNRDDRIESHKKEQQSITESIKTKTMLENKIHETKAELESTKDKLRKAEKGIVKLIKVDASKTTKHVKLPASGIFKYEKTDKSANTVVITPSVPGQTIGSGLDHYELYLQDENVTLELSGKKWTISH